MESNFMDSAFRQNGKNMAKGTLNKNSQAFEEFLNLVLSTDSLENSLALLNEVSEEMSRAILERINDPELKPSGVFENEYQQQIKEYAARHLQEKQTTALQFGEEIRINNSLDQDNLLQILNEDSRIKIANLLDLQSAGNLKANHKADWETARRPTEYNDRFGFDIDAFLSKNVTSEKQVILEFGPGNGLCRQHRQQQPYASNYIDIAMCDNMYYPINSFIQSLIDFDKLEQSCGELSEDDRALLCDFMYKILVIKEGQFAQDEFEYDEEVISSLQGNARSIVDCLRNKVHLLEDTDVVPGSGNANSKNISFEEKIAKPDSTNFHEACVLLSKEGGLDDYIPSNTNSIYDKVPVHTPGTIISDFSKVDRLANGQIDFSMGIRSTVYLEGDDYCKFMTEMTNKISENGFYIDDNVRENFGWNYRLKELRQVQKETGYPLRIILGPGVEGEDFEEEVKVPLAVILTKSEDKMDWVEDNLQKGYSIVDLDELLSHKEIISQFAKGRTYESLKTISA